MPHQPVVAPDMTNWTIQNARQTYNIDHWSGGYFDIDEHGHLVARPQGRSAGGCIDFMAVVNEARAEGLSFPLLLRFVDVLHHRVETLCDAFDAAISNSGYQGEYTAVYPIKVNQQRNVVNELLRNKRRQIGLEAGSKPELLAVMALSEQQGGIIVCNGYKDREYVRLALIGRKLGHRIYIVVEKLSELELVLTQAEALRIEPLLGVRVRLASIGAGKWQNTGGEKAKFGLSASQVLTMVQRLRDVGKQTCLQLLHCHLGSQIANIADIQRGVRECARFYVALHESGIKLNIIDVGGGLGIDYEGTKSRSFCSMNYSIHEYANNVVGAFSEVCRQHGLPHPDIVTESGRALTAHHAVLITNVVDTEQVADETSLPPPPQGEPLVLQELWRDIERAGDPASGSVIEAYHNARHRLEEAQSMYVHGVLDLRQRAMAEQFYFSVCRCVQGRLQPELRNHREIIDELNEKLADKYFCNFSLFQSLPDVWAIDQIFPIVPLTRLGEPPTRRGVIEDITCDSDGRVDYYVDREGIEGSLPLHAVTKGEEYLLGVFLVGAYQEILGDMHNLFGDTDAVNVELAADGGYRLVSARRGDTVETVLRYVDFEAPELLASFRIKLEKAGLTQEESKSCLEELAAGLEGYTYLED
jgi:arginine decarboxylase